MFPSVSDAFEFVDKTYRPVKINKVQLNKLQEVFVSLQVKPDGICYKVQICDLSLCQQTRRLELIWCPSLILLALRILLRIG